MPVNKNGSERNLSHRSDFGVPYRSGHAKGKRTENGVAIWQEPKPPTVRRLDRKNCLLVENGDDDWYELGTGKAIEVP